MFKYYFQYLIISFIIICGLSQECPESEDRKQVKTEIRLKDDLLCNYNKHFVPLHNRSEVMSIAMSMEVFEYDINNIGPTEMYLESEITLKWHDVFLMWNPADYDSMTELEMNTDEIWSPEIMPLDFEFITHKTSIVASTECKVTSSGNVSCTVISSHTGFCQNDVARWPYDVHKCDVQYMAWSSTEKKLLIQQPKNDTLTVRTTSSQHGWTITGNISIYLSLFNFRMTMSEMHFFFSLVRNTRGGMMHFYFLSVFVMTSLTLMCFWVNFEKTDRLILGLINIVYHMLAMQDMEWKFPRLGHTVPYVLSFHRDSLVFAFILLVETMVFKKILTSAKPTPSWLITIEKTIGKRIIGKILLIDEAVEPINSEQVSFEDELRYIKEIKYKEKKRTVQIIDRIIFLAFGVAYFTMITNLLTF